ncbi:MAG: DsbA family protein [Gammaproteobacteria bacterium]|nr:DsbA family protein [Gammaproteobacteria bacterium]
MSIEKLKANYPLKIRWVHFPLHPETPRDGMRLEDLFPGRDLSPMKERMKGLMAEAGLPYGDRSYTYNSRLAQELGKWADSLAGGEAIHDLLYKAYFVDSRNIGDIDELVNIAAKAGLDGSAARQMLEARDFESAVDEDWQYSRKLGVTGVPTFYANDLAVVGCQPYEVLERFVSKLIDSKA